MEIQLEESDRKQLQELTTQQIEANKEHIQVTGNLDLKRKIKRKSQLTLRECNAYPEDAVSYKAVGRMFMLYPMATLKTQLQEQVDECEKETKSLEVREAQLVKEIKSADSQLEEFKRALQKQYSEKQQ